MSRQAASRSCRSLVHSDRIKREYTVVREDEHRRIVRESKRITIWLDGMPMAIGIEELYLLFRRILEADSLEPLEVTIRVDSRLQVPEAWRTPAG